MSKVILIFLVLACSTVHTRFVAGSVGMPGAPVSKAVNGENFNMATEAMTSVQKGFTATNKQLLYFSSQVVAGVNYRMVWEFKGDGKSQYQCVTVWKKLYSQGSGYQQTSEHKVTDEKAKACQECNASDTCGTQGSNSGVKAGVKRFMFGTSSV